MNTWRLSKVAAICAAVALTTGVGAFAQAPGGGGMAPQGGQSPTAGSATAPGDTGISPPIQQNNDLPSFEDQAFLRKTLEDNVAEVQMGQLAAQKSSSPDVKQFGAKMAQIHEQLSAQMKPMAQKLGVSEPKKPSKKDREEIEKMQALSGADFDGAFIQAMMKAQKTDVKDFKDEAQSGQTPAVQQLAKMDAPVLSQHLQILEKLAQAHNVTMESKN